MTSMAYCQKAENPLGPKQAAVTLPAAWVLRPSRTWKRWYRAIFIWGLLNVPFPFASSLSVLKVK